MAATGGNAGYLFVGTAPSPTHNIAGMNDNSMPFTKSMYDTTSLGTVVNWNTFIPGLKTGKPVVKGYWDKSDTNGQLVVENAFFNDTLLYFIASPNNGTNTYSFTGYIADLQVNDPVNALVDFQYTIQITGAVTTT